MNFSVGGMPTLLIVGYVMVSILCVYQMRVRMRREG